MGHKGSCHCGRVAFEAEGEPDSGLACNCSMCSRKGSLLWFVPREQFHLTTPEDNAAAYLFNKHAIRHRFCPVCGIHVYAEAKGPDGRDMAAINLRVVQDIDLDRIPVKHFDGRSR